jgi:hypothetical protein
MTEVESTNFVAYRKFFPFSFKMRKSQSHSLQLKWPALKRICEKHSEDMLSESSVYQGLGMDWGGLSPTGGGRIKLVPRGAKSRTYSPDCYNGLIVFESLYGL